MVNSYTLVKSLKNTNMALPIVFVGFFVFPLICLLYIISKLLLAFHLIKMNPL